MSISTGLIAMLLAVLAQILDFSESHSGVTTDPESLLAVHIVARENQPGSDATAEQDSVHPVPTDASTPPEPSDTQQPVGPPQKAGPDDDTRATTDWLLIADEAARTNVIEHFRQQDTRAALWRDTHSVMFRPTDEIVVNEIEPLLADFRFKPEINVAGLGITIGSCFFGIPLVGVPVEQRTVEITVIVCAGSSG